MIIYILFLKIIVCIFFNCTSPKLLLSTINSMQILLVSSFFASIFLLIVNILKGNLKELKNYKAKDYIQITGIGLLGTFLYNMFLYLGINKMQASQAFIINYLWPITTIIFACIILKEKLTFRKIFAVFLSFMGVIIVTSNGNLLNIQKDTLLGALYCILAAISYGLFSVLNKQKNYNKFLSMMLYYFTSFIVSVVYTLVVKGWFTIEAQQLIGLIWIGVFTSATAFTCWAIALLKGETAKISNLAYITPFLSLIWIRLILKEEISIYAIIGLVFIVSGIIIQLKEER